VSTVTCIYGLFSYQWISSTAENIGKSGIVFDLVKLDTINDVSCGQCYSFFLDRVSKGCWVWLGWGGLGWVARGVLMHRFHYVTGHVRPAVHTEGSADLPSQIFTGVVTCLEATHLTCPPPLPPPPPPWDALTPKPCTGLVSYCVNGKGSVGECGFPWPWYGEEGAYLGSRIPYVVPLG
jgi:hypothetical protein